MIISGGVFIYVGSGIGVAILIIFGIILYCKCKHKKLQKDLNPANNFPNSFSNQGLTSDDLNVTSGKYGKPHPLKRNGKSNYIAKPYGDIGEVATSAFVTGHPKRLASITTISSSQSMTQVVQELSRGSSPVSKASTENIANQYSEGRRDSGYVDVNLPSRAELAARRSSELSVGKVQKPVPAKRPLNLCKQIHLKQKRTVQLGAEDNCGYLTPVDQIKHRASSYTHEQEAGEDNQLFRHASTGQAIEYCQSWKKMQKVSNVNPSSHIYGNRVVNSPSIDSLTSNDYKDLEVFQKDVYTKVAVASNNNNNSYLEADNESGYELPPHLQPKRIVSTEDDYANLNVENSSEYQNFDYNFPNINPTAVDKEDVYLEFLPD